MNNQDVPSSYIRTLFINKRNKAQAHDNMGTSWRRNNKRLHIPLLPLYSVLNMGKTIENRQSLSCHISITGVMENDSSHKGAHCCGFFCCCYLHSKWQNFWKLECDNNCIVPCINQRSLDCMLEVGPLWSVK